MSQTLIHKKNVFLHCVYFPLVLMKKTLFYCYVQFKCIIDGLYSRHVIQFPLSALKTTLQAEAETRQNFAA